MSAMVYNDLIMQKTSDEEAKKFIICPKAMVFVSDQPCFKVLSQILEVLYTRVVIHGINEIMFPAP